MNIINAIQGSQQWLDIRAKHFTASEAPAMMGASKYQTRSELLRQKHTGLAADVDSNTQRLFDRGHAAEAAARTIAEAFMGAELFPATGAVEVDGLPLLASFDGVTMLEDACWENKLWNATLADAVRAGQLEPHYYWQLEQQLLVSGAEKAYFTTSDGTPENTVGMWYVSLPERRAALIAGWKQFAEDLANYQHTEQTVAPVAAPIEALPALAVTVNGSISLVHNLERFGQRLAAFVQDINTKPQTDQDFVNLDAAVKVLKEAETALDAAESNALAQTSSIADMCNLVAAYRKLARDNRLMFEKIVKQEKENRKAEILTGAADALAAHVKKLNERIGGNWMPANMVSAARFAEAVKGLKSIDSMRDKVAGALANAKIEANEIADRIEANRKSLTTHGAAGQDWIVLFPDFAQVCTKSIEDFHNLVTARVAQDVQRQEAERERIRQEEADRLERLQKENAQATQNALDHSKKAGEVIPPQAVSLSEVMHAAAPADIAQANAPTVDAAMITEFIALQSCSPSDKKAMRATLEKWENFRVKMEAARRMQVAA